MTFSPPPRRAGRLALRPEGVDYLTDGCLIDVLQMAFRCSWF